MYLLDADYIISLLFESESTHQNAKKILNTELIDSKLYMLHEVLFEVANVISKKYSQKEAVKVIKKIKQSVSILDLKGKNRDKAWELFFKQNKNSTSIIDCANVAVARELHLQIVSFDRFYKKFG